MGARTRLQRMFGNVWEKHERRVAANTTAILTEALGTMLEQLADNAQLDAWQSPSAALIAATYRDAATRVRCSGIDLAETIRP